MKTLYKILSFAFVGALATQTSFAQKDNVGIGTTKPDQSAALDVSSNSKGFLMPRLSLQQRNSIQNPAKGLIVYQTDMLSGFYFYDGDKWQPLASNTSERAVAGTDGDWTLLGNVAGTGDFLGTTNAQPLRFRVQNVNAGQVGLFGTKVVFLGYEAGLTNSGTSNVGMGYRTLAVSTGSNNLALGSEALRANTSGASNTAVGSFALTKNTTGLLNVGVGSNALADNTTGNENFGLGGGALRKMITGSFNVAIGTFSLSNNTAGANNVAIGRQAGLNNLGSGNMFLGYQAGLSETGNNMLYVSNSSTANPLLKGNFDSDWLRINVGSATGTANTTATASYVAIGNFDPATPMAIPTGYRLVVEQGILTEKIKVALKSTTVGGDWSDYVFEDSYKLLPLEKVEEFIKENKHLPNVPSAEEMLSNGNDLIKTDAKLLEKIEELTLYIIEMNKELKALKAENEKLKK